MLDLGRYGFGTNVMIELFDQPRTVLRLVEFQDWINHLDNLRDQQRQVFGHRKINRRDQNGISYQDYQQWGQFGKPALHEANPMHYNVCKDKRQQDRAQHSPHQIEHPDQQCQHHKPP